MDLISAAQWLDEQGAGMSAVERYDWITHYKAVQTRIALAGRKPPEPARVRLGCVLYNQPIGPPRLVLVGPAASQITLPSPAKAKRIIAEVAREFGVPVEEMTGRRKLATIAAARMKAVYRIRTETSLSFPQIGKLMNRDHTSCVYSYHTFRKALELGRVIL